VDLLRGQAFVAPVVDLPQEIGDLRAREPGQLGGPPGALHGARVHDVEVDRREPRVQRGGLRLSISGERQVAVAGVTAGLAPLGLAMAGEVKLEAQAGLPIISGRPERSDRLALSITAPARTRWPGRTQTRPTAACAPCCFSASLTAESTRLAA
jgi:hypothetical protein